MIMQRLVKMVGAQWIGYQNVYYENVFQIFFDNTHLFD